MIVENVVAKVSNIFFEKTPSIHALTFKLSQERFQQCEISGR